MEGENKKQYSPFKLWGTYLGLLVGIVASYFSFAIVFHHAEEGTFSSWMVLIPGIVFAGGGLIGYFLHLIVRKLLTS